MPATPALSRRPMTEEPGGGAASETGSSDEPESIGRTDSPPPPVSACDRASPSQRSPADEGSP